MLVPLLIIHFCSWFCHIWRIQPTEENNPGFSDQVESKGRCDWAALLLLRPAHLGLLLIRPPWQHISSRLSSHSCSSCCPTPSQHRRQCHLPPNTGQLLSLWPADDRRVWGGTEPSEKGKSYSAQRYHISSSNIQPPQVAIIDEIYQLLWCNTVTVYHFTGHLWLPLHCFPNQVGKRGRVQMEALQKRRKSLVAPPPSSPVRSSWTNNLNVFK